jgi:hypothetical protein
MGHYLDLAKQFLSQEGPQQPPAADRMDAAGATPQGNPNGPIQNPESTFEWLLGMSLEEFAGQKLVVKVWSEAISDYVFFVSSEELANNVRAEGGVPYSPS